MKAFIILIVLFSLSLTGYGQSAQTYFNSSANYYVKDKKVEAMQSIRDGLAKYPNDEKLKALADKLKQEKKEQDKKDQEKKEEEKKEQEKKDQQQKDQQKKDEQNKDQQKKDQEKKEQEKKEQQEKEENKDQQQKDEKKNPEKDQQQNEQEKKDQEKQNNQDISDKLQKMNITPDMAKKLLEAMKNQEVQYLQQNKRKATKSRDKSKPDW